MATFTLAEFYRKLNLVFASKHYALITAYIGFKANDESLREFVPRGLMTAASSADVPSGVLPHRVAKPHAPRGVSGW